MFHFTQSPGPGGQVQYLHPGSGRAAGHHHDVGRLVQPAAEAPAAGRHRPQVAPPVGGHVVAEGLRAAPGSGAAKVHQLVVADGDEAVAPLGRRQGRVVPPEGDAVPGGLDVVPRGAVVAAGEHEAEDRVDGEPGVGELAADAARHTPAVGPRVVGVAAVLARAAAHERGRA